ncbi:antibiotic biosynthesis monooxygenase [Desmospora profundinema]|uniref:Heme oxygenase (Staphylobilin-producing) n=1 Tax=Desmospora profundinema TaxID=1571184 RepID=A0ABU1IQQ3_9BACL|nr:antibiotic biosynthesis monooxygenase [Desmospora profundinema]MDR6226075.1 heme oxygenase (staphylobilin-producing) [Desmospora profundinema]
MMIVFTNTLKIRKGHVHKLLERMDEGTEELAKAEGFLGTRILRTRQMADEEEVVIQTLWRSEKYLKQWTKSEAFRRSHRGDRPDWILGFKLNSYEVIHWLPPAVDKESTSDSLAE